MFDAYTVKKVIPRLVIATVLIQLSWPIFTFMVYVTGQIAWGIEGLLYAPFGGENALSIETILSNGQSNDAGIAGIFAIGAGAIALTAATIGGALMALISALLAVLIAFFVLAARQIVIIGLLVIAPLALVAWILPNTEKMWKIWWESFSKLLIVYPLIILLIASGKIMAYLAANGTLGGGAETFRIFLVFIAFFAPYFLIPATFKVAGSAFANIAGIANDRSRGVFDRLRNARNAAAKRGLEDKRTGNWFKGGTDTNVRGGLNRVMQRGMHVNKAGFDPTKWGARTSAAIAATNQQEIERNLKENTDYQTWMGNDSLNKAAAATSNSADLKRYLRENDTKGYYKGPLGEKNLDRDVARVESVRRTMTGAAFKQMTTLQAIAGGTAYDNAGDMMAAITSAAGDDNSALAYMIAKGKGAAMGAGRIDQGGGSFSSYLDAAQKLRANPSDLAGARSTVEQAVVKNQGPGSLMHASMKTSSIENLAPVIRQNLQEKLVDLQKHPVGSAERQAAEVGVKRELAKIAGTYDAMSQTSPAQAEVFAEQVMGTGFINAGEYSGTSIQQLVEANRGDASFVEMRREYQRGNDRDVPPELRGGGDLGDPTGGPPSSPPPPPGL